MKRKTMVPVAIVPFGPTGSAGQMVCSEEHSTGCRQVFYPHVVSLTYLQNTGQLFFRFLKISNGSLPSSL